MKSKSKYIVIIVYILLLTNSYGQENASIYTDTLKDSQIDSIFIQYYDGIDEKRYYFNYVYDKNNFQVALVTFSYDDRFYQMVDSIINNRSPNSIIHHLKIDTLTRSFRKINYIISRLITSTDTVNQFKDYIDAFYINKTDSIYIYLKEDLEECGSPLPISIRVMSYKNSNEIFRKYYRVASLDSNKILRELPGVSFKELEDDFNPKFKEFYNFLESLTKSLIEEKR